ncbi:MAG: N-acetyl-gamma-glutamyl-phosphate reductase [Candidatus Altiarchaeota archaeon]
MKAIIVGASGYTGRELLRILSQHQEVESLAATSRSHKGKHVSEVHKSLSGVVDLKFTNFELEGLDADLAFLAVPHTEAMKYAEGILEKGIRIVDLSADFRLKDEEAYEKHYKVEHSCPELIREAVYGLPEYYRKDIRGARLVANPGCYPTGAILACKPLADGFTVDDIIIDSKSGVSGAGVKKEDAMMKFVSDENLKAYRLTDHQHTPEIIQELGRNVFFTPHIAPLNQGIYTTVHALTDADAGEVIEAYMRKYGVEPFVEVVDETDVLSVRNTNKCTIGGFKSDGKRMVITSAIDNLIKGASGQAVQNMNIMMRYEETTGLV